MRKHQVILKMIVRVRIACSIAERIRVASVMVKCRPGPSARDTVTTDRGAPLLRLNPGETDKEMWIALVHDTH